MQIKINVPIMVEAELDQFGMIRVRAATWPSLAAIEQDILKMNAVKLALVRTKLRTKE